MCIRDSPYTHPDQYILALLFFYNQFFLADVMLNEINLKNDLHCSNVLYATDKHLNIHIGYYL